MNKIDNCFEVLRQEYTKEYSVCIKDAGNTKAIAHQFATVRACNKAYSIHRQHQTSNGFLYDFDDFKTECFSITGAIKI